MYRKIERCAILVNHGENKRVFASRILSYIPCWPSLSDTVSDSHLDLVKDRNSPDDLEAKTGE